MAKYIFLGVCFVSIYKSIQMIFIEMLDLNFDLGDKFLLKDSNPVKLQNSNYNLVITDDEDHPYQLTPEIAETTEKIVKGKNTEKSKALAIFDWFMQNIKYDHSKLGMIETKLPIKYFTSSEIMNKKYGICGEMAALYISMARYAGLQSYFLIVNVDTHGKSVNHACAIVQIGEAMVMVDPAYRKFNIHHKKISLLSDEAICSIYKGWRRSK